MASADDNETTAAGEPEDPSGSASRRSKRSSSGGLDDWMKALREMAPYLDLGWRLAGAAAGPPLIGHFLVDVWLGTTPWGLLSGCVLGIAAAVLQLKQLQDEFGS